MSETEELGIDDAVNNAMSILEKDGLLKDQPEEAQDTVEQTETGAETPTEEVNEEKPSEPAQPEAETPIEPPASLRSDEKDLFKSLPREMQETYLRLQQASDSHFTQRSTELAQKIRATDDERQQYQTERAAYMGELERLSLMAAQLLPAKFQDVRSQADYLRLKATDPQRASEYEAFQMTLNMANQQLMQQRQAGQSQALNREWSTLVSKMPNNDAAKAKEIVDAARKGAVEYYGYTPQEANAAIDDHRRILVMQDALAWRNYQSQLKAAAAKKATPTPTKVLKQSSPNSANLATDRQTAILKRAQNARNDREKANHLAQLLG